MMNNLEPVFFTLLRSAIWNTTPELKEEITASMWNDILAISKEQTAQGIIFDAIAKLPATSRPPKELVIKWITIQKTVEKQNIIMNNEVISVIDKLEKTGIKPYLLKGQGVAQNYPIPQHRICGDIDLYFTNEHYIKSLEYFSSLGCTIEDDHLASHAETEYNGIKIELHKKSATFYTKKLQSRYNEITDSIISSQECHTTINGKDIAVLPPMANALQMLSHILRHMIFSGLGLRQVCDWVLFIHKHQKQIDKELFIKYAKELQLWETYKAVTAIATDYLGLPKEYALCELTKKDKKLAKKAFQLIMTYGNFGHYGEHVVTTSKMEYLKSYMWKVRNCIRFRRLSRSETWNYPIWQLHSIKNMIE